jgi:hypothetical protein
VVVVVTLGLSNIGVSGITLVFGIGCEELIVDTEDELWIEELLCLLELEILELNTELELREEILELTELEIEDDIELETELEEDAANTSGEPQPPRALQALTLPDPSSPVIVGFCAYISSEVRISLFLIYVGV